MPRKPQPTAGPDAGAVRAAGGLVRRAGPRGPEVLLVHRPRYDDWTFPKGKLQPGESDEQGALREVAEETGLGCRLEEFAAMRRYRDRYGRPKEVRYWVMTPVEGAFRPSGEVDRAEWLRVDEARDRLTYPRDRPLLRWVAQGADQSPSL